MRLLLFSGVKFGVNNLLPFSNLKQRFFDSEYPSPFGFSKDYGIKPLRFLFRFLLKSYSKSKIGCLRFE
jgi:hypothetical protein